MLINNKSLIKTINKLNLTDDEREKFNKIGEDDRGNFLYNGKPVIGGATEAQATQIEANKTAIGDENSGLIKEVNDLTESLSNVDAVSLNGKSFSEPMTKAEYDALLDKDPNTIYLVDDDSSIISLPEYSSIEANKVLAVNNDGTALAWVNAPSGSGSGLTTEQANQLTTAYNHSQTVHVQTSDIPTKLSQLENDLVLVSDSGKKFKLKVSNDGVLSAELCEVYADIIISSNTIVVNESSTNTFTVALNEAPTNNQVVSLSVNNNNCTLDKTSLTFTSDNYTNQTVRVTGAHDSNSYEDKSSIITLSSDNVTSKTINVTINNIDTPPSLQSISAVYTQGDTVVYPTTSLDSLKSNLVVTATYSDNSTNRVEDYTLSGTLTVGTSTITATYQGKTATFDVNVVESTEPILQSISAVYTQADNIIYPASPLTALTYDLVVTAIYSDDSTAKINSSDYKLSGTLTIGTSTITVTYQDKTTTFDVNVIEKPSISEFTSEHFMIGRNKEEAVDGYFTVNRSDGNRISINFKSKEIAMGMSPLTNYDVTLNIVENTMDSEIINNTSALLFNTSGSNLNPAITANYIGESTFKISTVQESWFTDRVNRFYNAAITLNDESATSGYIKFSVSMKPHIDNV